jgi:hypothetical protein
MAADIKKILDNTKEIYMTDSSLETLLDYERVLDDMDLYAYANWKRGELVEGPIYEKYFITCTWMYDYKNMPDPSGAERLLNYGCEITYKKDILEYPVKVKSPDDFKPGTKVPRMVKKPIWLITITLPKQLMSDIEQGSIELENDLLDQEDIEQAAEEGQTDDVFQQDMEQPNAPAV